MRPSHQVIYRNLYVTDPDGRCPDEYKYEALLSVSSFRTNYNWTHINYEDFGIDKGVSIAYA